MQSIFCDVVGSHKFRPHYLASHISVVIGVAPWIAFEAVEPLAGAVHTAITANYKKEQGTGIIAKAKVNRQTRI